MMRRLAPALALAVLLAGCATGTDTTTPTTSPTGTSQPTTAPSTSADTTSDSPTATPSSTSPAGEATLPFTATTEPDTAEGTGAPVTVTDVRVGQHDGYDRVVLDVAGGGMAGWDARYVDDPSHQGSGDPVEVDGQAVLAVDLTNIGIPDDTGVDAYDGPDRLTVGDTIVEVVVGTTFEGHMQVFVGTSGEQPFRVLELDGSVVIDVAT